MSKQIRVSDEANDIINRIHRKRSFQHNKKLPIADTVDAMVKLYDEVDKLGFFGVAAIQGAITKVEG